jgi:hypothetical protein
MNGVVGVYLKSHKMGEDDTIIDYLGVGSFWGQYSMFEENRMAYGFKPISSEGVLVLRIQIDSIKKVQEHNQEIRNLVQEITAFVQKNGPPIIDFVRHNARSPTQDIFNEKKERLLKF